MPSQLRKRKGSLSELPRSAQNPRPSSPNSPSHVAFNRQKPTIAPTVFLLLVLLLTLALVPIFYYTQVLLPDPESKSILSNFRIKGNILLSALGHTSSSGHGRMDYVENPSVVINGAPSELKSAPQKSPQIKSFAADDPRLKEAIADLKRSVRKPKPQATDGDQRTEEEQAKLDEELGNFWRASSEYRRDAQAGKAGQYAMRGDGTVGPSDAPDELSLDDLPEADPDAKEGLTPEIWAAIKEQVSADDLTVMLDAARRKEKDAKAAQAAS